MKRTVIGILAHVDAGKTTLSEAMLYISGSIRSFGRLGRQGMRETDQEIIRMIETAAVPPSPVPTSRDQPKPAMVPSFVRKSKPTRGGGPLARGIRAEERGDLLLAESCYREVLKGPVDAAYEKAATRLAADYARQDVERTIAFIDEVVPRVSAECQRKLDYQKFLCLKKSKRTDEAYELAKQLNQSLPNDALTLFIQQYAYEQEGTWSVNSYLLNPATTAYGELLARDPEFAVLEELGEAALDERYKAVGAEQKRLESSIPGMQRGRCKYQSPDIAAKEERFSLVRCCLNFWRDRKGAEVMCVEARRDWRNLFLWRFYRAVFEEVGASFETKLALLVWTVRCAWRGETHDYYQDVMTYALLLLVSGAPREALQAAFWLDQRHVLQPELEARLAALANLRPADCARVREIAVGYGLVRLLPSLRGAVVKAEDEIAAQAYETLVAEVHAFRVSELKPPSLERIEAARRLLKKKRLGPFRNRLQLDLILNAVGEYIGCVAYPQKDACLDKLRGQWRIFRDRYVLQAPSLLTVDVFLPLLQKLVSEVEADFGKATSKSVPLKLSVRSATRAADSNALNLELELHSCEIGAPTIRTGAFFIADADGRPRVDEPDGIYEGEGLVGGATYGCALPFQPQAKDLAEGDAGSAHLNVLFRYTLEDGENREAVLTCAFDLPEIEADVLDSRNPYGPYQGLPAVGSFFVGRDKVMGRLFQAFADGPGGQCRVLWGLRRSGKTSIRDNLAERLKALGDVVLVSLDAQAWTEDAESRFTEELVSGVKIQERVRDRDELSEMLSQISADARDVKLDCVSEHLRRQGLRLVVLLDEASTLYNNYLERGRSKEALYRAQDFLRFLLTNLAARRFHLLLIGQDTMKGFLGERFLGNEFSKMPEVPLPLGCLREPDVRRLVLLGFPNLRDGRPRVTEAAFAEIFRLTGGAPLFVQGLLFRLYEHMVDHPHRVVVDVDEVQAARDVLCWGLQDEDLAGEGRLTWGAFEQWTNLRRLDVSAEDLKALYRRIAASTKDGRWCVLEDVARSEQEKTLVEHLRKLSILKKTEGKYCFTVPLFGDWLRANSPDCEEDR